MTSDEMLLAMRERYYAMDHRTSEFFDVSDEEWDAAAERMEQDHDMPQLRAGLVRALVASSGNLDSRLRPHFMGFPLRLRGVQT